MRLLLAMLGLLVVVGAGILLGVYGRALFDARLNGPPGPSTAAKPRSPRGGDDAPRAVPDAARNEAMVEITEAQLEEQLNGRLAGQSLGVTPLGDAVAESFAASLRAGRVELGGWARLGPARAPFTVVGSLTPDAEGRLKLDVSEARVGDIPMPDATEARLERSLQGEIDHQLQRQPVRVRSVEVGAGRMRIIGSPRA